MHNTYACEHSSGQQHAPRRSTCRSREMRVLCSVPDTMRDLCGNHTQQLIVMRLRELFSPPDERDGIRRGTLRSGDKSLDLSMM